MFLETRVPLASAPARSGDDPHPPLDFVEVSASQAPDAGAELAQEVAPPAPATLPAEPGWSLWGDLDV